MRYQRPVRGGREKLTAAVLKRIDVAVRREAAAFGCSRSFVINNALAWVFGVDLDKAEDYRRDPKRRRR